MNKTYKIKLKHKIKSIWDNQLQIDIEILPFSHTYGDDLDYILFLFGFSDILFKIMFFS